MSNQETFHLSPFDVANWFTCTIDREAGDSITHLKLQKLIYYAQVWSIAIHKKSLFVEDFEAWSHGPVLPVVYRKFSEFGFQSLPSSECDDVITGDVEDILIEVKRVYGELSAKKLEELTHQENPWIQARNGLPLEVSCSNVISKDSILGFYSTLLNGHETNT